MHPTTVEARDTYPAATEKVYGDETRPVPTYDNTCTSSRRAEGAGRFPVDTSRSSWERDVLERELSAETLVGWYLFFHQDGDDIVTDVIDPHRHDLADAAPKWSALARYAQDHPDWVRRVLAVIKTTNGELRALDLTTVGIAVKIETAVNKDLWRHCSPRRAFHTELRVKPHRDWSVSV